MHAKTFTNMKHVYVCTNSFRHNNMNCVYDSCITQTSEVKSQGNYLIVIKGSNLGKAHYTLYILSIIRCLASINDLSTRYIGRTVTEIYSTQLQ